MAPVGTARRGSGCRTTSCFYHCRPTRPNSTRWRMSGIPARQPAQPPRLGYLRSHYPRGMLSRLEPAHRRAGAHRFHYATRLGQMVRTGHRIGRLVSEADVHGRLRTVKDHQVSNKADVAAIFGRLRTVADGRNTERESARSGLNLPAATQTPAPSYSLPYGLRRGWSRTVADTDLREAWRTGILNFSSMMMMMRCASWCDVRLHGQHASHHHGVPQCGFNTTLTIIQQLGSAGTFPQRFWRLW